MIPTPLVYLLFVLDPDQVCMVGDVVQVGKTLTCQTYSLFSRPRIKTETRTLSTSEQRREGTEGTWKDAELD